MTCPKKWSFFTNLGQGMSQTVGFFLILEKIVRPSSVDKMLALSNNKSTFLLVSVFFAVVFSQFCPNII